MVPLELRKRKTRMLRTGTVSECFLRVRHCYNQSTASACLSLAANDEVGAVSVPTAQVKDVRFTWQWPRPTLRPYTDRADI